MSPLKFGGYYELMEKVMKGPVEGVTNVTIITHRVVQMIN